MKCSKEFTTPIKYGFLKYKVLLYSISFSKILPNDLNLKELDMINQLNLYCNKPSLAGNERY